MAKNRSAKARKTRQLRKRRHQRVGKAIPMRTELLEARHLLAVGPQLIAIIPNSGEVLQNDAVRNVSPEQLTFVFNEGQEIDESTLDAIRIVRTGGDGTFVPAFATSDLLTGGQVVLRFQAVAEGASGDGITVQFEQRDFGGPTNPRVSVEGEIVTVELNSSPGSLTTAAEVVSVLNGNLASRRLLVASVAQGSATVPVAGLVEIPPVVLAGANSARGITDLNSGDAIQIEFVAASSGIAQNGVRVLFDTDDLGEDELPIVSRFGRTMVVVLNTTPGSESTAAEVVEAVNGTPTAASLATAALRVGNPDAEVATGSVGTPPLVLQGAADIEITPGYIGVDPDRPNQVIVRFAEQLPDDRYSIDILGIGDDVLRNTREEAFDCETDFRLEFEVNLGAEVLAVVPQPITRNADGTLSQAGNVIEVYFNDDDLNPDDAVNPAFYQLIKTQDTVNNLDDSVVTPTLVEYDSQSDTARLFFGADLNALPGGPGTYRLRIGTDEALPMSPMRTDVTASVISDLRTSGAVQVRLVAFENRDNGPLDVRIFAEDFGDAGAPRIGVDGDQITIRVNSNVADRTTAAGLIAAVNLHPFASERLRLTLESGLGSTVISGGLAAALDLTLSGPEVGDTFTSAYNLGALTTQSQILRGEIDPQVFQLELPGSNEDPGHRSIPFTRHVRATGDVEFGVGIVYYNFRDFYGTINGVAQRNVITATQTQRVREVLGLYSHYLGIQFIEADQARLPSLVAEGETILTFATGDLRVLGGNSGPGGVVAGFDIVNDGVLGPVPTVVFDNAELWNDEYGALSGATDVSFFESAVSTVGLFLNLGLADELPPGTILSNTRAPIEPIFPGGYDILHGQFLHQPESKDIDLYRFTLNEPGKVSFEVIAERLSRSSRLDATLTVYRQNSNGTKAQISQNDDYFSEDSFVDLDLESGTYFAAVTASGNNVFDPHVEDSGFGGTSQGEYDLRINFRPQLGRSIRDATGIPLDGDNDGAPGGVSNYWFRASDTVYVDKAAGLGVGGYVGDGSIESPFRNIKDAFNPLLVGSAAAGDVVRIVGNGGADGNVATLGDNFAYEIGFNSLNQPLQDGTTMEVPRGVSVVVDAGAVMKLRRARIGVGSSAPTIDRSAATMQILGTPEARVIFTSYDDQSIGVDTNPLNTTPRPGDWGGISFRNDLDLAEGRFDYESRGIFLNHVNFADMRFGGGDVVINSVQQIVTPIQFTRSRPTITNNLITNSADAAMSGDPDSFEETNFHAADSRGTNYQAIPFTSDYGRVGPEIHNNTLVNNTINGLFFRIVTPAGGALRELTVSGRWDDTDIVHVLTENLVIKGSPSGAIITRDATTPAARQDARLAIDPGTIVKLDGARIEVGFGAQMIAEGDSTQQVVMTSLRDSRFGAGGTFETNTRDAGNPSRSGDWGGIYVSPTASLHVDNAQINFGGGVTKIEGSFSGFNTIEVHQGFARIANSRFERNADGVGGQTPSNTTSRAGRGFNQEGVIFVRGAQPIITNNLFVENEVRSDDNGGTFVSAINVDVNSLSQEYVIDTGRARGFSDRLNEVQDNQGPLVRGNQMTNRTLGGGRILGMVVRGGVLTTESVWDDTDITHVLFDTVTVANFHTHSGVHLESAVNESLVVKLQGADAGFTATGEALEQSNRIGGRIQIVGQPGFPVVLTSLADDSVGAGSDPNGAPLTDTNGDGFATAPTPGDWRSVLLDQYSHDRNVQTTNESETVDAPAPGPNGTTQTAQVLGILAPNETSGDDNRRLGFEVQGYLTGPNDVDVYSFLGTGGTEVRFDIDKTSHWIDTVVELVDANGQVIASSDNSIENDDPLTGLGGTAFRLADSDLTNSDFYSSNPRDAGFRTFLPGSSTTTNTYHVRVRMSQQGLGPGNTSARLGGNYELGIRLRDIDETAGSVIRFADIRYATNGIDVQGLVAHSPLIGEAVETTEDNETFDTAQTIGNLLTTDRGAISLAGNLSSGTDIDWYTFEVGYSTASTTSMAENQPTSVVFDIDYADQLGRANTALYLFDANQQLVYFAEDSNNASDLPAPMEAADFDDLSRGSVGRLDPFLGPVSLPPGTYSLAVTSRALVPTVLGDSSHNGPTGSPGAPLPSDPALRREPANALRRIAEDFIGGGNPATAAGPVIPVLFDEFSEIPYRLDDVALFVTSGTTSTQLTRVNAKTGFVEGNIGAPFGFSIEDVSMRWNGELVGITSDYNGELGNPSDDAIGNRLTINTTTGEATLTPDGDDGIETYEEDSNPDNAGMEDRSPDGDPDDGVGIHFQAFTFTIEQGGRERLFAIGHRPMAFNGIGGATSPFNITDVENILYELNPDTGAAIGAGPERGGADLLMGAGTQIVEIGALNTAAAGVGNNILIVAPGDAIPHQLTFRTTNPIRTFEMVTGPLINYVHNPSTGAFVRDGDNYTLTENGGATTRFEFDTGPVLNVTAANGSQIADGDTLTITDVAVNPVTFEFEDITSGSGNGVQAGNIAITFRAGDTGPQIAGRITSTINARSGNGTAADFMTVATLVQGQRISLTGDSTTLPPILSSMAGLQIQGEHGVTAGSIAIPVEEFFNSTGPSSAMSLQFQNAILNATPARFMASADFNSRTINFPGAETGSFPLIVSRNVFADSGNTGIPQGTNIAVPFGVGLNANQIASLIAGVMSANGVGGTTAAGNLVTAGGGSSYNPNVMMPFLVGGTSAGGLITGMAEVGMPGAKQLFVVTDAGGLFQLDVAGMLTPVPLALGGSIQFSGLAAGPENLQDGEFAEVLFGIDNMGTIYAFDTQGVPQNVFSDGTSRLNTGIADADGLVFGKLDFNLWHPSDNRNAQNRSAPFDRTRNADTGPNTSWYFGFEDRAAEGINLGGNADALRDFGVTNSYDLPGGARGSLQTASFSLEGYEAADQPVLYFDYFLETEDRASSSTQATRDAFRVFASDAEGNWRLIGTNNQFEGQPNEFGLNSNSRVGPPRPTDDASTRSDVALLVDRDVDNPDDGWRQARIDLSDYAGQSEVSLRFDFSTAGTMTIGGDGAHLLKAVDGDLLRDGDTFGVGGNTFEFDLGYVLAFRGSAEINDATTFTVTDAAANTVTFEFDKDGTFTGGNVPIVISDSDSPAFVASAADEAIRGSGLTGITTHFRGRRLQFEADSINVTASPAFTRDGLPGVAMGTAVAVHWGLPAWDPFGGPSVSNAIRGVLAGSLTNGQVEAIRTARDTLYLYAEIDDAGPLGRVSVFDPTIPGPVDGLEGDAFGLGYGGPGYADISAENAFEGVYIDNFLIGFASRGELITDAPVDTSFVPRETRGNIVTGAYQLEIRRAEEYTFLSPTGLHAPFRSFDVQDRLISGHSFEVPAGSDLVSGQTFLIRDLTFEFVDVSIGDVASPGNISVPYATDSTAHQVAQSLVDTINSNEVRDQLAISASVTATGTRVDLFGATGILSDARVEQIDVGPNDSIPSAVDISAIVGGTGTFTSTATTLQDALDVDMLSVDLVQGQRLWVDIDSDTVYGVPGLFPDLVLRLFDENGTELLIADDVPSRDEFDFSLDPYFEFTAETAGTYYIGISGFANVIYDPFVSASGVPAANGAFFPVPYDVEIGIGGRNVVQETYVDFGDENIVREQGQLVIGQNRITNSAGFGILVAPGQQDDAFVSSGPPRVTREVNTERLVPGITIVNNVVAGNETGAIRFAGDVNGIGSVPFGRLINNTLYGVGGDNSGGGATDTGVLIENNAGPTLLNNIIANFTTPISLDATSSATTVIGGTLYKDNVDAPNLLLGDFNIDLDAAGISNRTLFVSPLNGNFYLDDGSLAIDSSIDSLQDRPSLVRVNTPLGISPSPILAPDIDLFGLTRVDDPNVQPPSGLGENVFKDRGAIERADTEGPTVNLREPLDNDPQDQDTRDTVVQLLGANLARFVLELVDGGVGIDDQSVGASDVVVTRNGVTLTLDVDYRFDYDSTNNRIVLSPQAGIWLPGNYEIVLNNNGIFDLARNSLQPNQTTGETKFTISIGEGLDFGDAPDPSFPSLLASDGARHGVQGDFFLGSGINAEADAQQDALADGDLFDDGVILNSVLVPDATASITVIASQDARLDAWIDFNGDGDWDDLGEQIFLSEPLLAGDNALSFQVPLDAAIGDAFARFRMSSIGGLLVTGLASDGEVEDYRFEIETPGIDFGDAPSVYPTLLADNGARHEIIPGFYLGEFATGEPDALVSSDALGDMADDGVVFENPLSLGATRSITVTASQAGRLDAWFDFNGDGDWDDAGEQIFTDTSLVAGSNLLSVMIPATATVGQTFARFRLSSAGGLAPTGFAADGEVEDYRITISEPPPGPFDYGDAPAPYPTLLADDGARHFFGGPVFLGETVDDEPDGLPSIGADADTGDDGVVFNTGLALNNQSQITVSASAAGLLNAFIDFNADGDWRDAGEQLFVDTPLVAGANTLFFEIPITATIGETFMRFRFSTEGGLSTTGEAIDGEVEDYRVEIGEALSWHNAALPTDVDDSGVTAPLDALLVINELDLRLISDPVTGRLPFADPPPFYDVTNDGFVSPLDALLVINALPSSSRPAAPLSVTVGNEPLDVLDPLPATRNRSNVVHAVDGDASPVLASNMANDIALRSVSREWREGWYDRFSHPEQEETSEKEVDQFFASL